jgi:hypothetical protein
VTIRPTKPNLGPDRSAFQRLGNGNGGTTGSAESAPDRAVPLSHPLARWDSGTASPRRRPRFRSLTVRLAGVLACAALALSLGVVGAAHSQSEPKSEPNKSEPNKPEPKSKIAFIGDSTGDGLWGGVSGLLPREACLKNHIELGRFAKNSTGLTRPDRFNWADEVRKIGDGFKPQLFVMSLGLNDRQSVVEHGTVTLETSPDYPAKYRGRVTAVLKSVAAAKASLLWVGLPAMRDAAADRDAREKNKYFAQAIAEFGDPHIEYVEPWRLNPSGDDKFASFGPDKTGKMIQIRASDGEHFTPAGDLLVAAYLLPKMTATLVIGGAKLGEACAS